MIIPVHTFITTSNYASIYISKYIHIQYDILNGSIPTTITVPTTRTTRTGLKRPSKPGQWIG